GAAGGLLYQPTETTGTVPLFATATGNAWLATLESNEAVQHVARQGGFSKTDRYGPNVIRSIDALLKELRATGRRGYGLAFNEAEPGVTAIAAAIRSRGDKTTVGTVSIAGPSARMTESRVRELAPLVMQCVAELSTLWPVRPRPSTGAAPDRRARSPTNGEQRHAAHAAAALRARTGR
ncbi:MAG: IclR family transcriptional regulator C-terminal domain-containing protein, partial [Casimicrobiaceae bacterium]